MTTAVRRPAAAWAAAHRTLLVLLALAVVVLATVAVTIVLRSPAEESTPAPTTPSPYYEQECSDPPLQLITFRPFC
jgi:hypothetical protein